MRGWRWRRWRKRRSSLMRLVLSSGRGCSSRMWRLTSWLRYSSGFSSGLVGGQEAQLDALGAPGDPRLDGLGVMGGVVCGVMTSVSPREQAGNPCIHVRSSVVCCLGATARLGATAFRWLASPSRCWRSEPAGVEITHFDNASDTEAATFLACYHGLATTTAGARARRLQSPRLKRRRATNDQGQQVAETAVAAHEG